jgi:transposase
LINIGLYSSDQTDELRELASNHPHHLVRRKGLSELLKSQGMATSQISFVVGVCENTVRSYLLDFLDGGIQKLTEINFYRPQSALKAFDEQVKAHLTQNPVSTIKQAGAEVAQLTGVSIKETQMRHYLKSLGLVYRKVASIPAKADIQAQQLFKENKLEPRLEEAKAGIRDLYFVDAAHFVLGAFLGYLWSFTRLFVKTPSGRQRFNVLGALNAVSHELVTVTNATYITSIEVGQLLQQLANCATRPITIVLDNAKYQRCQYVIDIAEKLNIELLFLPPYSPNLNLIERLWKFVKKHCLNSRYHSDFKQFTTVITEFLGNMNERHAAELDTLLTLKFQTFTEEQILKAS